MIATPTNHKVQAMIGTNDKRRSSNKERDNAMSRALHELTECCFLSLRADSEIEKVTKWTALSAAMSGVAIGS